MGQITVLNGTNVPLNTCISMGVNYSWCNSLMPKQYYRHEGAAGIYTLSAKYWIGPDTEYSNSGVEIGLTVLGLVVGIVGVVLAIPSAGASLALVAATATFETMASAALGLGLGTLGLAIAGISIGVKDFINAPAHLTSVHATQDRKFIAEGNVELALDNGTVVYKKIPEIKLRELTDEEFVRLTQQQYVEYQSDPALSARIDPTYLTQANLSFEGLLDTPQTFTSQIAGNAVWEIENDGLTPGARVQLWSRSAPEATWRIKWAGRLRTRAGEVDTFTLYNHKLDRYVTLNPADQRRAPDSVKVEGRYLGDLPLSSHKLNPVQGPSPNNSASCLSAFASSVRKGVWSSASPKIRVGSLSRKAVIGATAPSCSSVPRDLAGTTPSSEIARSRALIQPGGAGNPRQLPATKTARSSSSTRRAQGVSGRA